MARYLHNSRKIITIGNSATIIIKKFSFIILSMIFITLFILHNNEQKAFVYVRGAMIDYTAPIISKIGDSFNFILKIKTRFCNILNVYKENELLHEKIEMLQMQSYLYDKVIGENAALKKLLQFVKSSNKQYFTARILINSNSPFTRSVVISAGKNQGAFKGQIIVNEKGLVGRIIEVNPNSSRILLITDPSSRISFISAINRERGIIVGNSSSFLDVLYTRDGVNFSENEMVVSSGDSETIPYGIPIGLIEKNKNNQYSVKPFVQIEELEYVIAIAEVNSQD